MTEEEYNRRKILSTVAGIGTVLSSGCLGKPEGLSYVEGSQDHITVDKDHELVFSDEDQLYGLEIRKIEGEEAKVKAGSYEAEELLGRHNNSYKPVNTDRITVEPEDVIESSDIEDVDEMPDIRIDDVDRDYIQIELPYEVEFDLD